MDHHQIKHLCHEHLLSYVEKSPYQLDGYSYSCDLCNEICNVDLFLCMSCWEDDPVKYDFRLHKRCAKLPQEITSPHHDDPNHKLTIYCYEEDEDSRPLCDECLVPLYGICYSCSHCDDFKIHLLCASAKKKMIQHCTHEHPLIYFEELPPYISSNYCGLCLENCDGDLFFCVTCKYKDNGFRLHKRCAEQPEEITLAHHTPNHKLILSAQKLNSDYYAEEDSPAPQLCGECVVPLSFCKVKYSCSHCDFALHPLCAWSSSAGAYESNKQILSSFKHTAHHHDMVLYELDRVSLILKKLSNKDDDIVCAWCGNLVSSGMFYACLTCGFHLHKGCAFDMPGDQITHPSHPQHSLHLNVDKTGVRVICFVCGDDLDNSICFTCGVCDNLIGLHARCASGLLQIGSNLFNKRKQKQLEHPGKGAKEIQHFAHEHPLIYDKEKNTEGDICHLCLKEYDGGGLFYCEPCNPFFMHRRCAEQPEVITHPWHPNHRLTLLDKYGYDDDDDIKDPRLCNECFLPLRVLPFSYCCLHCDFNIHFSCAMVVAGGSQFGSKKVSCARSAVDGRELGRRKLSKFKHTAHAHDLILYEKLDKITRILHDMDSLVLRMFTFCAWCGKRILLADKLFACFRCHFFLHQDCTFDIPRKIIHPFHQPHRLSIEVFERYRDEKCIACGDKVDHSIGFQCEDDSCSLLQKIHGRCASLLPSLKSTFHDLTYFEKANYPTICKSSKCSECPYQISSERDKYEGFYRCVACNISFHLSCILPATKIHKYHSWHLLALRNSRGKDNDFHTDDEVYCDICEMRRDSNHCVYKCETCSIFDAHIECAIGQKRNKELYGYAAILNSMKVLEPDTSAKSSMLREGQIKHPDHDHVLDLKDVVKLRRRDCYCRACYLKVSGQAYTCTSCPGYFLHQVCANLSMSPTKPLHDSPVHPVHPLALHFSSSRGKWFICDVINGQDCFNYRCRECEFIVDFKCISFHHKAPRLNKLKRLVSIPYHRHPLRLGNYRKEREILYCSACVNPITGLTYCCATCGIFLHEPCAFTRFPQKLRLPFHPISFELDTLIIGQIPNCLACQFPFRDIGLYYKCRYCLTRPPHYLHPTCSITLKRPLVYKSHHEHNLYYFDRESQIMFRFLRREKKTMWHECTQCHESCTGAFYYCMDCRSYFHLECLPIPQVVKSKCHLHNLNLEKSFMDEGYDLDDQHCDICEEKRKPEDHVYVCKECSIPFAGHIECVLPRMHRVIETPYQRPLWNQYDLDSNDEKIVSEQKQPFKLKVKEIFNQVTKYWVLSVDLHQTNPWILVVFEKEAEYGAYIWNYESQKKEQWLKQMGALSSVKCAKFISPENLIVLGDENGFISIYNHDTSEIIYTFKAHGQTVDCVVVHSSCPYVLSSSSGDGLIKLWNWEKGWSCTRKFYGHYSDLYCNIQAEFNPIDDNAFASALEEDSILIWNIDSPDPIRVYQTSSVENPRDFTCFRFLKVGAELYVLRGIKDDRDGDGYVKVFDYKTKICIQTLVKHGGHITAISAHPDIPIIITASEDGMICIWNSLNWSLVKTLRYGIYGAYEICCIKGSNRVVFGCFTKLVMVELTLIEKECDEESLGVEESEENDEESDDEESDDEESDENDEERDE